MLCLTQLIAEEKTAVAVQEHNTPPVWPWYVGYYVLIALLYLLVGTAGLQALFTGSATSELEENALIE
jgi:hypothetical protein